jgi:hypothetical protein
MWCLCCGYKIVYGPDTLRRCLAQQQAGDSFWKRLRLVRVQVERRPWNRRMGDK